MKKLLLAAAVLMFLPQARASCTVTITPPSFTLQTSHTQKFTATTSSCSGGSLAWSLSCAPSGHCSNGSVSPSNGATVTYTAPSSPSGITTPEVVTLTAKYNVSGVTQGSKTDSVTITAVQMNSLLNYASGDNSAFQTYVISNASVSGVNVIMNWATIESSNGANNGPGTDDFSAFESALASLFTVPPATSPSYTKKINIIVQGVTGGCAIGSSATCGNSSTPSYVFSNGWANTVNATINPLTGVDYVTPVPLDVWTGCGYGLTGTGGFPAVIEPAFYVAYQNFISKVLTQYTTTSTLVPYIGYIRFGLSAGGEVYPFCEGSTTYSKTDWLTYVSNMDNFESAGSPAVQLMTSINQKNFPTDLSYPDTEASDAKGDGIGFGSQGLQQGDITGTACTSDWCALFNGPPVPSVPRELQTTLLSDPIYAGGTITGGTPSQTGSLSQIIPFAIANNANIFELYAYDVLYAFDTGSSPNGYCNLSGATSSYCTSGARTYPLCYATIIQDAENGVSLVPTPPTTYDTNYCTN